MSETLQLCDIQAEIGIIGTLTVHPEYCVQISWLKPSYFYRPENKYFYWAIEELIKNGVECVDDFNIIKIINENKAVQKGFNNLDISSVESLLEEYKIATRNSIEEYQMLVNRVINLSYRRQASKTAETFAKICLNTEKEYGVNDLNMVFHEEMNKLAEKYILNQEIALIGETIDSAWDVIVNQRQNGMIGIPSKYDLINEYFTYQNSELVVVGGRAKAGKSSFFLNEIHCQLKRGLSIALFDTEMKLTRILPRMLALESGLTIKEIENGSYIGDKDKEIKVEQAIKWWKQQKFIHIYDPSWTFDKIYTTAKILKIRKDFDLNILFFDYIKETNKSDSKGEKLAYFLGDYTNFLKNQVAGDLDIAVVAGAQMSPYDTRLADSDSINRYASVIAYWLYKNKNQLAKEKCYEAGSYKLTIEYNRLGDALDKETEGINFKFDTDRCLIEQADFQPLKNQLDFDKLSQKDVDED